MSFRAQAFDGVTLAAKVAGLGAVGLAIEDVTGYPGAFWIAAILGAVLIRRPIEGEAGERTKLRSICAGVGISWIGTNALMHWLGLAPEVYMAVVAGALAAFGEQLTIVITSPEKLQRWLAILRGGR